MLAFPFPLQIDCRFPFIGGPGALALLDMYLPSWMNEHAFAGLTLTQWVGLALSVVAAVVVGTFLQAMILYLGQLVAKRSPKTLDRSLLPLLTGPIRLFLACFLTGQLLPWLELSAGVLTFLRAILTCGLILALAWLALRLLGKGTGLIERYMTHGQENTAQARAVQTQVQVVRAILRFLVVLTAAAVMLMQFEVAWSAGLSLLASASLAGVILGFAANRTLTTLVAGIQLAFSKAVRIGDEVTVEGQFGQIEDIRMTHVVVKLLDRRRLILPVTYFLEKPFENWTTTTSDLTGAVLVYTDFSVSIEEMRQELATILAQTVLWDRREQSVQVTNLTQMGVEVRLLVSAADSGRLWDLRCLVREKILAWLQARVSK
jgi:small-conductance mechanosensitive channel